METSVQTTSLPDKGVWHRVRVGPYSTVEDLNRARDMLKQNGIETSLIRVRETPAVK
jgi:cell division protein FtsN